MVEEDFSQSRIKFHCVKVWVRLKGHDVSKHRVCTSLLTPVRNVDIGVIQVFEVGHNTVNTPAIPTEEGCEITSNAFEVHELLDYHETLVLIEIIRLV